VVVAGATVLALELQGGSGPMAANPVTSPARGTSESGTGRDGNGSSGGTGDRAAGGDDGAAGGASPGTPSSITTTTPGPIKVQAICTTVAGNLTGSLVLGSCSQTPVTGGSGTLPASVLTGAGSATISWTGGGTTTFVYTSSHPASQRRKCPEGDMERTLRGSVTGNATVGRDDPGIKGPVRAKLCVDPKLDVRLAPGRAFQL